jgi:SAM-dependent methyltransferase
MRNPQSWKTSKFIHAPDGLRISRDPSQVYIGSRFIGDILARTYEQVILKNAAGRLLDLGCGHVPLYGVYRDLVEEVVCVDWANSLHPSPHLDREVDLNGPLPFDKEVFDTVLLTDVLEHIAEPARLILEIARILAPGGKLIAAVPFLYWLHEEPHDYYRYTAHALRRFAEASRLQVLELEPYGGLPEVMLDLSSKGIEYLSERSRKLLRPVHTAIARHADVKILRRLSEKTKAQFPLGYILVAANSPP